MRSKIKRTCATCALVLVAVHLALAEPPTHCILPAGLEKEISALYPGTHLITLAALHDEERKVFVSEHGSDCPGLVSIDFYGDGKPTFALVLLRDAAKMAELIVAHKVQKGWQIRSLETADARPVPVVWSDRADKYEDVYGQKTIIASNPVILLCGYGSWAILYAWNGEQVEKIWIAD